MHSPEHPSLERNTLLGFVASIALAVGKFLAGWLGHSTALIADATESLADTLGSIMVWQALRLAARPADRLYPYGYGKAQALAALGIGILLGIAALIIVVESVHKIATPHEPPAAWTLAVLIVTIMIKESLFRLVHRGAEAMNSDAARADAWHHRADAITSLAALVGVSLAIWGPELLGLPALTMADEVAAILASGIILLTARSLIGPALRELLDAASPLMAEQIADIVSQVDGVTYVEQVLVRKSGSGYLADMHMHVPGEVTVQVAHQLTGKVKAQLRQQIPNLSTILIHVEPSSSPDGTPSDPEISIE